jgi:spermidine/putrescine transport system ATP-binding protein
MLKRDKAAQARVDEMIEMAQLGQFVDRKSSQMSGGQQQRVALARAMAPSPRFCRWMNRCQRSI